MYVLASLQDFGSYRIWPSANKVCYFGQKKLCVECICSCVFSSNIHYISWKIGFYLWKLMYNGKKSHAIEKNPARM